MTSQILPPLNSLQQTGAGWLWGLIFHPLPCEPSCCESCRLDSIVCGCGLTGAMVLSPLFIHVHFQLKVIRIIHWSEFSVNVWVSREVKTKIRKKTFELQVKQKLLNNEMTNSGTSASYPLSPLSYDGLAVVLIVHFCFQGWEFKYSFRVLRESTVSCGGCCRLYLYVGLVQWENTPVFSFLHSLHSSVDVGCRMKDFVSSYHCKKTRCVVMLLSGWPLLSH